MGKGTVYVFKPKLKTTRVGLVGARQECHRETGWVGCYWGKPRETGMIGQGTQGSNCDIIGPWCILKVGFMHRCWPVWSMREAIISSSDAMNRGQSLLQLPTHTSERNCRRL